jgi:hypothetical protein
MEKKQVIDGEIGGFIGLMSPDLIEGCHSISLILNVDFFSWIE